MATKKDAATPPAQAPVQAPPAAEEKNLAVVEASDALEIPIDMSSLFEQDAGSGFENVGANDMALPFVSILQKGSPQVSRANAKYIKDATSGMFMNTVTGELVDGDVGFGFIPCGYKKKINHWTSRDSGGGFLGSLSEGDPLIATAKANERGQLVLPDSTILIDTAYHYGLILNEEGFPSFAIVSLYSTGLKVSRNWNTVMGAIMKRGAGGRIFRPPTFAHVYRLTTVGMQKDNYDWFQLKVSNDGEVTNPEIYAMAKQFAKMVSEGLVKESKPAGDFDGEGAEEGVGSSEKLPF